MKSRLARGSSESGSTSLRLLGASASISTGSDTSDPSRLLGERGAAALDRRVAGTGADWLNWLVKGMGGGAGLGAEERRGRRDVEY